MRECAKRQECGSGTPGRMTATSVAQLQYMCYTLPVKTYVHARLDPEDRAVLEALTRATGQTESEIVREGLRLMAKEHPSSKSARHVAGRSVGRFKKGPKDLSTRREHLGGFGE